MSGLLFQDEKHDYKNYNGKREASSWTSTSDTVKLTMQLPHEFVQGAWPLQ